MVRFSALLLVTTALPGAAPAQQSAPSGAQPAPPPAVQLPGPTPTPVPTAPVVTPTPAPSTGFLREAPFFPGAPRPTSTPAPTATPAPVSTPRATTTPRPATSPTPRATPTPTPTPPVTPTPRATPSATAIPTPTPEPSATPTPVRTPPPPIETVVLPQPHGAAPVWPWLLGAGAALAMSAIGWRALRRRGEVDDAGVSVEVAPAFQPLALPTARLQVSVRPTRAGLNLISATVDAEVTLTNTGDAPAHEVRVELRLFSLTNDQSPVLDAFYAEPITRPSTPPFTLAPGEERRFRVVTALAHADIHPITAGGRPMFVPLLALAARYRDGDAARGVAQAFAVGVERVDSAKLAPFWLDAPARSYDQVGARAHGAARETIVA